MDKVERLVFLLESSLTAAGFSLVALLVYTATNDHNIGWTVMSGAWAVYMTWSL